MVDHSVASARDQVHESEANKASVVCNDNIFLEESCFVVNLVCHISPCPRVFVFLNATRRNSNLPLFARRETSGSGNHHYLQGKGKAMHHFAGQSLIISV